MCAAPERDQIDQGALHFGKSSESLQRGGSRIPCRKATDASPHRLMEEHTWHQENTVLAFSIYVVVATVTNDHDFGTTTTSMFVRRALMIARGSSHKPCLCQLVELLLRIGVG